MKGYDLKPDPYAKKSFWHTWPGVILGSIGIVLGIYFFWNADSIAATRRSEFQEIKGLLIKGDHLKNRYELVSNIEAESFRPKGTPALWKVDHDGQKSFGYFTVNIEGWTRLSEKQRTHNRARIYFEKTANETLVITKIEIPFSHRVRSKRP